MKTVYQHQTDVGGAEVGINGFTHPGNDFIVLSCEGPSGRMYLPRMTLEQAAMVAQMLVRAVEHIDRANAEDELEDAA